jgi:polyphosphate kinase
LDKGIQKELLAMLQIQIQDNQKARIISKTNPNQYRQTDDEKMMRSQVEIYNYLKKKHYKKEKSVMKEDI